MVGGGCRSLAEAKIPAVLDFPTPRSKIEIRRILGMIECYSRYIENYATLVEPLTRALKSKKRKESIEWTEEMEKALERVKDKLTQKPVLFAPDFKREFIVQTDASDLGVGVILTQRINGEQHPILYLSRKFSGPKNAISRQNKSAQPSFLPSKNYVIILMDKNSK
ncbi:Retrovirus-related Pol polyprotein from transposon 412 [Araneus ventricosus]|uniref:Retrovirus-related Pol polyprotein from transposon 412 n=1 Tax=Araneus ventricosus TaxID=182803 RepID=A0A4Y2SN17_ARAVE|nr:Retrovirus-related Pol polyprotein from transposon 412 [Araneus ventricosus]